MVVSIVREKTVVATFARTSTPCRLATAATVTLPSGDGSYGNPAVWRRQLRLSRDSYFPRDALLIRSGEPRDASPRG